MSKYDKLKLCPFCNSEAALRGSVGYDPESYYILCTRCDAVGPKRYSTLDAIDSWNTRPPDLKVSRSTETDMVSTQASKKLDGAIARLNEQLDDLKQKSLHAKKVSDENEALKLSVLTIANELSKRDEKVWQQADMISSLSENMNNMRRALKEISKVMTVSGLSPETDELLREAREDARRDAWRSLEAIEDKEE